jgi:methylenetetrahydrofolate reductase (NADPH)
MLLRMTLSDPTRRLPGGAARVADRIAAGERSISFEFFPPRDQAGERQLWTALRELEPLQPTFVSVTYGAGGSTRDRTIRLTERIAGETTLTPMAHLTCVGHSREELRTVIGSYAAAGVRNVLAVRGDPPGGPGTPWTATPGGLTYATELIALVRSLGDFCVGAAAFPEGHREAESLERDAGVMRAKQEAGAEFAITELFFRVEDYLALRDRCDRVGVAIPLVPGIMPITNLRQIVRMAELSGRQIPAEVVDRVSRFEGDPAAVRAEGVAIATEMCDRLLGEGAPGLHFYTLNRSTATREIHAGLRTTVG